jgi:hypothetical protein
MVYDDAVEGTTLTQMFIPAVERHTTVALPTCVAGPASVRPPGDSSCAFCANAAGIVATPPIVPIKSKVDSFLKNIASPPLVRAFHRVGRALETYMSDPVWPDGQVSRSLHQR